MALILAGPNNNSAYTAAAIVFAIAASTDFVDGYLARRWAVTTKLGSFLDTTADKLLVSGALIALVDVNRASPWIAAIIVGRELLILGLRGVVAAEGTVFPAPRSGASSRRTSSSSPSSWRSSSGGDELGPLRLDEWALLAAALITVVSAVEYIARFSSALSEELR